MQNPKKSSLRKQLFRNNNMNYKYVYLLHLVKTNNNVSSPHLTIISTQENLLRELSNKGDILQDAGFLASLSKTRATNETIAEALAEAREIERVTRVASQAFEPSAQHAATLALATNELATRWLLTTLPVDFVQDAFVDAIRKQPVS